MSHFTIPSLCQFVDSRKIYALLVWALTAHSGQGTETQWAGGSGFSWPSNWSAISGKTADLSGDATASQFDLVGDANGSGLKYTNTLDYACFRMTVNTATMTTAPRGSYFVMVDSNKIAGPSPIDYGFAWDAINQHDAQHGLEGSVWNSTGSGTTWGSTMLDDIDSNNSNGAGMLVKGVNDINGLTAAGSSTYRSTDGYVRSIDGQNGQTFIDIAVSWDYLRTYTDLRSASSWNLALATNNNNDHAALNSDVFGADLTESISGSNAWRDTLGMGVHTIEGDKTFAADSIFTWDVTGETPARGSSYDCVEASGLITGDQAVLKIALGVGESFSNPFWDQSHSWANLFKDSSGYLNLESIFGSFSGSDASVASNGTVAGRGTFTMNGSSLVWTAVPEPANTAAGLLLGAGLLRRRRKHK